MPAVSAFSLATASFRSPGPEKILETYYEFAVLPFAQLTFDYQYIGNPAYNTQRGPVSVFALRMHAQF